MYVYLTNPLILHAILGLAKTKIMYFTVHNRIYEIYSASTIRVGLSRFLAAFDTLKDLRQQVE